MDDQSVSLCILAVHHHASAGDTFGTDTGRYHTTLSAGSQRAIRSASRSDAQHSVQPSPDDRNCLTARRKEAVSEFSCVRRHALVDNAILFSEIHLARLATHDTASFH